MSAGAHRIEWRGAPGIRTEPRVAAVVPVRPWIRLVAFAALAAYGTERWATMLRPAPGWRLVGLVVLAVVLAGGIPLLARFDRVVAAVAGFLVTLTVFPIAGLRWEWFVQLRVAVSANTIGDGLAQLPSVLVPYVGHGADVRLVIVLGAAVLLLDAAAVLAFAGPVGARLGDGRRAAVALPLTALAVVPSTLVRPQVPYLQGLVLFALLGAFLWGERVRRQTAASALVVVLAVGIFASLLASDLDPHKPWINYRAWAGTAAPRRLDSFDWNQTYGPLRWPHSGHEVLTVQAHSADYWKAEDLDVFNGKAWVQGSAPQPALPPPRHSALVKWTQTLHVSIEGMQTRDLIAAGSAGAPSAVAGGVGPGADAGTWVSGRSLGPGTSYTVATYSPRPTARQLATAGRRYPAPALAAYLTLTIPQPSLAPRLSPSVQFAPFTAGGTPAAIGPRPAGRSARALLRRSPYARAYALARRLAAGAATPYAYVRSVQRYLANGFSYDQNPAVARYPLETFLFSSRQGYCQQFSGAMALLLRMGGIPARVAAGFTTGSYDASARRWVVTDTDAHAWVEAWFPRYGWVRFDPTPASAPARGSAAPPILKASAATAGKSAVTGRRNAGSRGIAGTHGRVAAPAGGTSPWPIAAAVIAALALAGLLWRVVLGGSGGRISTEALVDELDRALVRTRRPLAGGATLAGLEERLRGSPSAAAYVHTLRMARYGRGAGLPTAAQRRALRVELARGLGLVGYLRALWALPPRRRRNRP